MARVTVEDCIRRVPNRFELVLLATRRARDLAYGAQLTIARQNDRNSVIALREIAEGSVCVEQIKNALLSGMCSPSFLSHAESFELTEDELLLQEELLGQSDEETLPLFDEDEDSDETADILKEGDICEKDVNE